MIASTLVLVGAAPATAAEAKPVLTRFSFQSSNWSTRVVANDVELRSARTAYSYIACTRVANRRTRTLGETVDVNANDMIRVQGLQSHTRTYKKGNEVGVEGTNLIAGVRLGPVNGPSLSITGLETTARAFHVKGKGFDTAKKITWAKIALDLNGQGSGTGTPLDQLLDAINTQVVGRVIQVLVDNGPITIPGLGEISLGRSFRRVKPKQGSIEQSQYALIVKLANGSKVQLGRAWAKISTDVPSGVFQGAAFGTNVSALELTQDKPIVRLGRTAAQPLPCNGTKGEVRTTDLAGLNLLGLDALDIGAIRSQTMGRFGKGKRANAWAQNTIAQINLGPLQINAIKGRANVRQGPGGKVTANSNGTTLGSIIVDGQEYSLAEFLAALPDLEIPSLLAVRTNVIKRLKRGIQVIALQLVVGEGAAGDETSLVRINLGNAIARIRQN